MVCLGEFQGQLCELFYCWFWVVFKLFFIPMNMRLLCMLHLWGSSIAFFIVLFSLQVVSTIEFLNFPLNICGPVLMDQSHYGCFCGGLMT